MSYRVVVKESTGRWDVSDNKSIARIDYNEVIGLQLPIMKLTILTTSIGLSRISIGQKVSVEVNTEGKPFTYSNMEIVDIISQKDAIGKEGGISGETVTLNLVYGLEEWVNTSKIEYFKDNPIAEVLETYGAVVDDTVKDIGVQNWIRANVSRKRFVRELVRAMYISNKDCPVTVINQKGLLVKSLRKVVENTDTSVSDYISDSLPVGLSGFSTSNAIQSLRRRKNSFFNIHKLVKNKTEIIDYRGDDIDISKTDGLKAGGYFVDADNVYDNYFRAGVRNDTAWLSLSSEKIAVGSPNPFRWGLEVLDGVEFTTLNPDERYNGKWIVTEKYITLTPVSLDMKGGFILNRIDSEFFKGLKP